MQYHLALITGASSGIGWELVKLLDQHQIPMIISGRSLERLKQLSQELSSPAEIVVADLAKDRTQIIELIRNRQPDLVVNNAGLGLYGSALDHSVKQQMELLELNANAVLELTLEAGQALKKNNKEGVILNVSSAAAFQVFPYFSVYSATKSFVNQLSESLDAEWRDQGIRVLTSCPGMVKTNFRRRAGGEVRERDKKAMMTPEYAALKIWKQIQSGKSLNIFNWKYHLGTFISRYLMPKKWLSTILKNSIKLIARD